MQVQNVIFVIDFSTKRRTVPFEWILEETMMVRKFQDCFKGKCSPIKAPITIRNIILIFA